MGEYVPADFARQLETELVDMGDRYSIIARAHEKGIVERDQLRTENAELKRRVEELNSKKLRECRHERQAGNLRMTSECPHCGKPFNYIVSRGEYETAERDEIGTLINLIEEKGRENDTLKSQLAKICDGTGACPDGKCVACKLVNSQLEVEQLKAQLTEARKEIGQIEEARLEMHRQLDEAGKDSQRLDWLDSNCSTRDDAVWVDGINLGRHGCVRQAIDAAITATKENAT